MKNALANRLLDAKRNGVKQGEYLMSQICLLALENTLTEWDIPVADSFYGAVEKEMQRIYAEVLASVPSGEITEMAERLTYYVDEIRKRRKMDAETEEKES